MPELREIYRVNNFATLASAGPAIDAEMAVGQRAIFVIELPFEASDWQVDLLQSTLAYAPNVLLWAPVYRDGNMLCIPFERHNPAIVPVIAALGTILTTLLVGVALGLVVFVVYSLITAAEKFGGSFGVMLAASAALMLLPSLFKSSTQVVSYAHNPARRNPLDTSAVLPLAGAALGAAAVHTQGVKGGLPGWLQDALNSISPKTYPKAPPEGATKVPPVGTQPGSQGGTQPAAVCGYPYQPGNTRLTFEVTPSSPGRYEGAPVVYSGRLMEVPLLSGPIIGDQPVAGATIEFWDAGMCGAYDYAVTDSQGYYRLERPLASDELNGYRVFARYPGSTIWFGRDFDPAITGVWAVVPQ